MSSPKPCRNKSLLDGNIVTTQLHCCNNQLYEGNRKKSNSSKVYRVGSKYAQIIDELAKQKGISKREALEYLIAHNRESQNGEIQYQKSHIDMIVNTINKIIDTLRYYDKKIVALENRL